MSPFIYHDMNNVCVFPSEEKSIYKCCDAVPLDNHTFWFDKTIPTSSPLLISCKLSLLAISLKISPLFMLTKFLCGTLRTGRLHAVVSPKSFLFLPVVAHILNIMLTNYKTNIPEQQWGTTLLECDEYECKWLQEPHLGKCMHCFLALDNMFYHYG